MSIELPKGFHPAPIYPDPDWSYEVLYSDGSKEKGHHDDFQWATLNDGEYILPHTDRHIIAVRPLSIHEVDEENYPLSDDEENSFSATDD